MLAVLILCPCLLTAQNGPNASSPPDETLATVRDLQEQVRQLRSLVNDMRSETMQTRTEMQQLRQELQTTRALLDHPTAAGDVQTAQSLSPHNVAPPPQAATATEPPATVLEERVQKLEESASLMGSKIDEQYQTKVETASKYRARLSGIVLMNMFRNVGGVNSIDFPDYAQPTGPFDPTATIGATLRQSEIGLEIFGPTVAGAKTVANIQFDFAGGFPATGNGINFGIMRLQTASLRLNWENTSVVAGQDSLFFSPLSPTSFASLATPTFGYSGNLWGWTPQLRVEHRFALSDRQTLTLQGGILDNVDWEFPLQPYDRLPQAGEQAGQPAYAIRTSWSRPALDHQLSFGVAGYYGRQNWTWGRYVDGWAGMADWQVPVTRRLAISGEFYRGRGAGGLGAGLGRSVVFGGDPTSPFSPLRGLNTIGGWSQLKLQITPKLEFNGAFGEDNSYAADVRGFAADENNFGPILGRNRSVLGNLVFRPRSDLLFSAELRRLRSFPVYSNSSVSNQVNLAMGILF